MEKNLYAPPKAELKESVKRVPRPKTAILTATFFDLFLTTIVILATSIVYGAWLHARTQPPSEKH